MVLQSPCHGELVQVLLHPDMAAQMHGDCCGRGQRGSVIQECHGGPGSQTTVRLTGSYGGDEKIVARSMHPEKGVAEGMRR